MFLGHLRSALALKRMEPKISLGTLFIAVQLVDILWGGSCCWAGSTCGSCPTTIRCSPLQFYDYPISHSLLGPAAWALAAAALYYSWPTRDTTRHWQAAALVGAAVRSHWLLDLIVHVPDLPLGGQRLAQLGLGLWRHVGVSVGLELLILGLGLAFYARGRTRRHPLRPVRLAVVLVPLVGIYVASLRGAATAEHPGDWSERHRAPARGRRARGLGRPGATPAELAAAGHPPK